MNNDRIWILLTRKLSGEATQTELEELLLLQGHNPEADKTTQELSDFWYSNSNTDNEFLEATYLLHLERMKSKGIYLENEEPGLFEHEVALPSNRKGMFSLKKIVLSAMLVVVMISSWLLIKQLQDTPIVHKPIIPVEVLTQKGSRTKLLLPDGSNVWLNSGSKITYNKDFETGDLREVNLTGEAFFDVVKNTKRPFIIHTTKMNIKVLGTRFNVKAYEDDKTTETSLIKGSVEVYLKNNPGRKYLLKPNQKLVLSNDLPLKAAKPMATVALNEVTTNLVEFRPLTYLQGTETDIESSWTKNLLSFEDEAFIEVAKKMERWYDVSFEFKNKSWEQQFLNGSFEKENLEQAMKALKYTTGFNYRIEGRKIIIF
ncbi:MAG TPA: FecR family protein [Ferruginibacter sp.]|nr:FecR family protein [Ferruginibacter sp.]